MDSQVVLLAVLAASPGLYALITKRKALAQRGATSQFNILYAAQGKLVDDCQRRCAELEARVRETWTEYRAEIAAIKRDHAAEIVAFQLRHKLELEEWQRRYLELEGVERGHNERLLYLEELLRRSGIIARDSGEHRRAKND